MYKLVYVSNPDLFSMIFWDLVVLVIFSVIGIFVYQINKHLNFRFEKTHFFIWYFGILIFTVWNISSHYTIYNTAKDALNEPGKWHFAEGKISDYHHIAFNRESFMLEGKFFTNESFLTGENPLTRHRFQSVKKDILPYTHHIKIAYIDQSNPVIMKIWMITEKQ